MIYLDHNATTTIRPEVVNLITEIMQHTGNGSSTHAAGRNAAGYIEAAREKIARSINTRPSQIIFTSSATESINTILKTFKGESILAGSTEHAAVTDCGLREVEMIPVDSSGLIDLNRYEDMLKASDIKLVNIMLVNNETGVIQPIKNIINLAHQYDALIHVDAVQALGKIPIDFSELNADYMSFSAHKIGGPQGVGCFAFSSQKPIRPLLIGGKQEKNQRAGTSNTAGIAGMGLAAELAVKNMNVYTQIGSWQSMIERELQDTIPDILITGSSTDRVPNTLSLTCPDVKNTIQMMNLDLENICVSGGSACSSGVAKPSHVLKAMGLADDLALSTIRVSMGWNTTIDDVKTFIESYSAIIKRLKK